MGKLILVCAACQRPLTRLCREGEAFERSDRGDPEGPMTQAGVIVRMDEEEAYDQFDRSGAIIGRHVASPAGAWSINPEDVVEEALVSCGKDVGCCGSDGCDGPNRACRCGAVVGTEWSDCWTQKEVRLWPDAVRIARTP